MLPVSGSTRCASTNSAVVRTALVCAPPGVATVHHGMTGLRFFNPDDDHEPQHGDDRAPVAWVNAAADPDVRRTLTEMLTALRAAQ